MFHMASWPGVLGITGWMERAGALEKALAEVTWLKHMRRQETLRQIETWHAGRSKEKTSMTQPSSSTCETGVL